MSEEITIKSRLRKSFESVVEERSETYNVYVCTDGEEFLDMSSAKKHQKAYDRIKIFYQYFSSSLGNLRKGDIDLAMKVSLTNRKNDVKDSFWFRADDEKELKVMKDFLVRHYYLEFVSHIEMKIGDWIFVAIKKLNEKKDLIYTITRDKIREEIEMLEKLIPNFSKEVEDKKEVEEEDNKFNLLDI